MALVVNTNVQSLFAQRALGGNTHSLKKNLERLSTGFRINRASDDAAGLSISEKMTASIKGAQKAAQNSSDAISLLQTAEGALGVVQDNLQRIRELMVQALNGSNGTQEKNALQREINERVSTIDQIAKATKFNGQALIRSAANVTFQTGAEDGQTTAVALASGGTAANVGIDIDVDKEGNSAADAEHGTLAEGVTNTVALNKIHVGGTVLAADGVIAAQTGDLDDIDTMIDNVSRMRSYLGAVQNGVESKIDYLNIAAENMSAARSRIKDVDVASESSMLVKNQILQQSAAAMLSQANSSPQIALQLIGG